MERGVVRWFSGAHGYGFIQDKDGADIFVHFSAITMEGYKTLQDGEEVDFERANGPKGAHASTVVPTRAGGTRSDG